MTIQPGEKRFYKGIYPVEIVKPGRRCWIKSLCQFLNVSNYSKEMKAILPGDRMVVPANLVWKGQRAPARVSRAVLRKI